MITVNCAALPANLIESELFGREKGAFTGADIRRVGRFEIVHGSTLCLDEIGELPLELQAKLLRVIQHGEFERLGSSQTTKVDARIVATTNRDLEERSAKAGFGRTFTIGSTSSPSRSLRCGSDKRTSRCWPRPS